VKPWSLAQWLDNAAKNHHLPEGFSARHGIKSLFPPESGAVGLSLLQSYLYSSDGSGETPGPDSQQTPVVQCSFNVRADGAGNWLFAAWITSYPSEIPTPDFNGQYGAGFVFSYSTDSNGHGIIETGSGDASGPYSYSNGTSGIPNGIVCGIGVLVTGKDPWIADHWPSLFARGCGFYLSEATGLDGLPPTNDVATDHGFSGLSPLQGAQVKSWSGCDQWTAPSGDGWVAGKGLGCTGSSEYGPGMEAESENESENESESEDEE